MRQIHEKKWSELSSIWHELYEKNLTATPFQSYEFLTHTQKGKPYRKDLFRLIGVREWNLVLYDDDKPVAIAPLLVKKVHGKHRVVLRGHYTVANQLDFIYESWSYDDLKFLMDHIKTKLGCVSFLLDRISEKTVTCGYLQNYFSPDCFERAECFSIPVAEDYNVWLKSLSRSARGNISTYYNRLRKDNQPWSIDVYCNQSIDKKLTKKLMRVYADRFISKNGFRMGFCRKIVSWLLHLYLVKDQMTRWMNRGEGNFHAVLNIGSDVAAFASGLICRDKKRRTYQDDSSSGNHIRDT